jgi:hypothetical protein
VRLGLAGAASGDESWRTAGSAFASRTDAATFVSAEIAVAPRWVRTAARLVAGERGEWSAVVVTGAVVSREDPLACDGRERRGVALERRDTWGWGASRCAVSSLLRRDADSALHRRRVSWDGQWRIGTGARVELAGRVSREERERAAGGALSGRPAHTVADDRRARATLYTRHAPGGGWTLDNRYRLEWVQGRSGRPGTIVTWAATLRAGVVEGRLLAGAHALHSEQIAYSPDPAPLDPGAFGALAGRGASMTGSLRVWLGGHVFAGATWSARSPAPGRWWLTLGLGT